MYVSTFRYAALSEASTQRQSHTFQSGAAGGRGQEGQGDRGAGGRGVGGQGGRGAGGQGDRGEGDEKLFALQGDE